MDKIILVHYVRIGDAAPQRGRERLEQYMRAIKNSNFSQGSVWIDPNMKKVIHYFIPTKEREGIECIYPLPTIIADEKIKEMLEEKISILEDISKDLIKK